ncbi:pectinesterase [Senna tora]|uniref:Pectinesterase n=1 Tax=Senna tora TaxID=362788 RepID=A0A834WE77_9FABA|nr:pectinesterase [Senna tora]
MSEESFAGMRNSGDRISTSKKNSKLIFFPLLTTLLLVSATIVVAGDFDVGNVHSTPSHAVVKSTCSTTLYPELCFSAVTADPDFAEKVSNNIDVIKLSLNQTIRSVQNNYVVVKKFQTRKGLTNREQIALNDCLVTIDDTLDELRRTIADLDDSGRHADDLLTLMSAAMTNQETCLDGFSHDRADRRVREGLMDGEKNDGGEGGERDSVAEVDVGGGQEAPSGDDGVYRENVEVPKTKTYLMFVGDGRTNTIITGSRNVVDGSTTFNSATVAIVGERFLGRDITFQNTAGPSKHQAVALRVGADLSAFYRCDMLAYQDTLYVHSNRQFFVGCFIAGTVDFIFGNSAAVFQDCDIHARRPNSGQKNMVTAQGRTDPNQNTGIVIQKCRIGATQDLEAVKSSFPTYLGRPWKEYSRTVVMQSSISDVINPAGWFPWDGNFALDTLYYGEYKNTGAGADTSKRVNWKGFRVITSASEAQTFTPGSFIAGSSWLSSTGFPFTLGL